MKRRKFYTYNPETDNFERFYPSIKDRFSFLISVFLVGIFLAAGVYILIFYMFETPTVENLTSENQELKQQYTLLERRLESSIKIMNEIQNRDSNLYRVLLQMDPQL